MAISLKLLSLSVIFLFFFLFLIQSAHAATFTVNNASDTVDTTPGDGICADSTGHCTLRAAVMEANALPGADTITLPASSTFILTIAGTGEELSATGDLDITSDLTINGNAAFNPTIDGGAIDRVLTVHLGVIAAINGVTVKNGNPGAGFGAGGILNTGTLTLTNSTVTDNTGENFGGGIFNTGTLTLVDSTVSDNVLLGTNLSGGGGGIFSTGTLTLSRSTVSDNSTIGRGGGIYAADPTVSITNSTISGNTALNGGGIFNRFGSVSLVSSTIANNTATDNGGGVWNFGGTATFANTIVAGNVAATPSDNCAGGNVSLGYNIAGDASCAFGGTGDLNSTNPLLGPLANNGGPTETHALLTGSPAIDAVPLVSCTVASDQRGVPRPQGIACDSGAFELFVTIDIKPGSYPNSINLKSKGKISVAILSTSTFNAPSELDKTSLTFGRTGNETSLAFCNNDAEDVNGDGLLDQVCHFNTSATGFQLGDTVGILKANTLGGIPISASDSVNIVN